jgi:hypothetical protein
MNDPNLETTKERKSLVSEMKDAVMDFMVEYPRATGALAIVMGGVSVALAGESGAAAYTGLAAIVLGMIKVSDKTPLEKAFAEHPEDMPGTNKDGRNNPKFRKRFIKTGI